MRAGNAEGVSEPSATAAMVTFEDPSVCVIDESTLCLGGGRFRAHATWRLADGSSSRARVAALGDSTGFLWFFDPENVELLVKLLDGCGVNDRFWLFAGGLTNLQVDRGHRHGDWKGLGLGESPGRDVPDRGGHGDLQLQPVPLSLLQRS